MSELFLRRGRSVRHELTSGRSAVVRSDEEGAAETAGPVFLSRSHPGQQWPVEIPAPDETLINELRERALEEVPAHLELNRLWLHAGSSVQLVRRKGREVWWLESVVRLHLTVTSRTLGARLSIDLASPSADSLNLQPLTDLLGCLAADKASVQAFACDRPLRLSPVVAAALWHALAMESEAELPPGPVGIRQTTHPHWTRDGGGRIIRPHLLFDGRTGQRKRGWPNSFRPSFRSPAVPYPFHLKGIAPGSTKQDVGWTVSGLCEPLAVSGGRLAAKVLVSADGRSITGRLEIDPKSLTSALLVSADQPIWFPIGAGAYGATTYLGPAAYRLRSA